MNNRSNNSTIEQFNDSTITGVAVSSRCKLLYVRLLRMGWLLIKCLTKLLAKCRSGISALHIANFYWSHLTYRRRSASGWRLLSQYTVQVSTPSVRATSSTIKLSGGVVRINTENRHNIPQQ